MPKSTHRLIAHHSILFTYRYMLYVKVMDNTGEGKFLLFDSVASEIVGESAHSILGGSLDEVEF